MKFHFHKLFTFNLVGLLKPSRTIFTCVMAQSKFEYVKLFEDENKCLMNCWIVVRIDGKAFHRFSDAHNFTRPNDIRGLNLMTKAASCVMKEFKDVSIAYGQSDEYSFIFKKNTSIFNRRREKILSLVISIFSSAYIYHWRDYFQDEPLQYPPYFDARIVLYPTDQNLRDYMSWRQADVHINNLYNTCFWALVLKKQLTPKEAEKTLCGTLSKDKNELLFQEFNINYNNIEPIFRKGTTLIRKIINISDQSRAAIIPFHTDIIKDTFWEENSELLSMKKAPLYEQAVEMYY